MKDQDIVGEALASVLPQDERTWLRIPHLLKLNLILMIPLLSSAVAGYDGTHTVLPASIQVLISTRIPHERPPIHLRMEKLL